MKKLISFIATSAILLNSLVAPLSILAQETPAPEPTPTDSASITTLETFESAPVTTPSDIASPTPEIPLATDTPTVVPSDTPTVTLTPEGSPTTPGPPEVSPTPRPEAPVEQGMLTETLIENIDLSGITGLNSNVLNSGSITTDKPDYSPTSIVLITGSGFIANKTYTINIVSADEPPSDFTDQVKADDSGNISYAYQLDGNYRPNYTAYIKNGEVVVATTAFTDSVVAYSQCANDTGNGYSSGGKSGCDWINGNLQSNNSAYYEGDATPQRLQLTGLTNGTHTFKIKYGTTKGGKHAYDFITDDTYTENWITNADFCEDLGNFASCSTLTPNLSPLIPTDPSAGGFDTAQANRHFKIRNGTITSVGVPTLASGSYAGDSETTILITFNVDTSTCLDKPTTGPNANTCPVLITWGAHVSKQSDWGGGNSAVNISGSPYHVSLEEEDGTSAGSRDNQMQAGAIKGSISLNKVTSPSGDPTSFSFTTSGFSTNTTPSLTDTSSPIVWDNLENSTKENSPPSANKTYTIIETVPGAWLLTSKSCTGGITTTITQITNGISIVLGNGENIVCTFTNTLQQGTIELQKVWSGTAGQTTLKIGTTLGGSEIDSQLTDLNGTVPLTTGPNSVNQGIYYLSESGGLDNYLASPLSCFNDLNNNGNNDSEPSVTVGADDSVNVAPNNHVICSYTNTRKQGTIIVKKVMVGGVGTFNFTGTPSGSINANEGTVQATVDTGQYTSIEGSDPTGWKLTDISCDDSNSTFDKNARSATFNVEYNETVTCTFTNTKQPLLTVTKNLVPSNDPGLFDLQIDNTTYVTNVGNGGTTGAQIVNIGDHNVGELAGNNTDLANYNITYSPNCLGGSITLSSGDDETCTITNTRKTGNVLIDKVVIGGSALASDWIFTVLNVAGQYHDGDQVSLNTGSYTISESTSILGYTLTSVGGICSNMSTPSATLTVGEQGGTCIFTNTRDKGSVKVNKELDSDANGTYELGNSDANTLGFAWILDSDTNNAMGITIGNVETTVGSTTHSINEYNPGDYHFTGWYTNGSRYSCTTPEGTNLPVNISVGKGQLTEITFCNARDTGTIEIIKNTIGGNGTFGFTISGETGSTPNITTTGGTNTTGQETVVTGIYSVSESNIPTGWNPTSSSCTDGEIQFAPTDFTIESGDHIVCTFTNTKYGYMQGRKYIDTNLNGELEQTETFLDDWTINLYDEEWQPITTQLTGNDGLLEGQYRFGNLLPGTYYVCEASRTGWQQTGPMLGSHPVDYNNNQVNGSTAVQNGSGAQDEASTCWQSNISGDEFGWLGFGNIQQGHIIIDKVTDPVEDPQVFTFNPSWSESNFNLTDQGDPVDSGPLAPGVYSVSESKQDGWSLTGATCDDQSPVNAISLQPGETITCTFSNLKLDPNITVTKSNDKSGGTTAGSTVTYTLTVKNDGNIDLQGVDVIDILPGGFSFVAGSTTGTAAVPTVSGSVITWSNVGGLAVGASFILTYQTTVSTDSTNGLYTNFATCDSYYYDGDEERTSVPCNTANSTVSIGSVLGCGGSLQGQVLGASTELPATGSPTLVLIVALVMLATGLFLNGFTKREEIKPRKHVKK